MDMLSGPEYPGRDPDRWSGDPFDPEYLRARAEAAPHDWARWFRLGFRYLELCEPGLAVAPFRRVLRLAPNNGLAHYLLGDALMHSGRRRRAEPVLARAVSLRPDLIRAWSLLGMLRAERGCYADALEAWKHVARSEPDGEVYWQLGHCLMALNRPAEAMVVLEESVRLHPNHLLSHQALARLGKTQNQPDVMVRHLQQLFALNEDMARALDARLRP